MKNAIFWALAVIVVAILSLMGYGIYLSVTNASSPFDVASAVCTGFILVLSLVAWELLMKPGYYRKRAGPPKPDEAPDAGDEGSRPPRPSR